MSNTMQMLKQFQTVSVNQRQECDDAVGDEDDVNAFRPTSELFQGFVSDVRGAQGETEIIQFRWRSAINQSINHSRFL